MRQGNSCYSGLRIVEVQRLPMNPLLSTRTLLFVACAVVCAATFAPVRADAPVFPDEIVPFAGDVFGMTVADLNDDGFVDVVSVGGYNEGHVSVLLGRGHGSFHSEQRYDIGGNAWAVAAGDLNGDGRADLAVANGGAGNVNLFYGTPGGTFSRGEDLDASGPASVLIRDFNSDGLQDLAVSGEFAVSVRLGMKGGTLGPSIESQASPAYAMAAGDLNGDGVLDLLISGTEYWWGGVMLGLGDGRFVWHDGVPGNTATNAELADLNKDGALDVLTVDVNGVIRVGLNDGSGAFTFGPTMQAGYLDYTLAVADFDGDGVLDVASGGRGSSYNELSIFPGIGDGTFRQRLVYPMGGLFGLVSADLDDDGRDDLVLESQAYDIGPILLRLYGRAEGGIGPQALQVKTFTPPAGLDLGDLDRDGHSDLVAAVQSQALWGVGSWLWDGHGGFEYWQGIGVQPRPAVPLLDDLNGDGIRDLVLASAAVQVCFGFTCQTIVPGDNRSYLGTAGGGFQWVSTFDQGKVGPPVLADFNGDGLPDLAHIAASEVWLRPGIGNGTFGAERKYPLIGRNLAALAAGDFNEDGRADLVVTVFQAFGWPSVWVLPGRSDGLGEAVPLGTSSGSHDLEIGDVDGDGHQDIVVLDEETYQEFRLWVLEGHGDLTFASSSIELPRALSAIELGDFDNDGLDDIVMRDTTHLSLRLSAADPADVRIQNFTTLGVSAISHDMAAGDIDGDGRLDLAVSTPDGVLVMLNRLPPLNRAPVAVAQAASTVECDSPAGAQVTLDGSASSDEDSTAGTRNDITRWEWFELIPGGERTIAEGETVTVTLGLGSRFIGLRIVDRAGVTAEAFTEVTVVDTTPPALSLSSPLTVLWPPNHQMVRIPLTMTASDRCGPASASFTTISSNESDDAPGGFDGVTSPDIELAPDGSVWVRAERDGTGAGRTYTLMAEARDAQGLSSAAGMSISVPHDMGGAVDPIHLTLSQTASGTLVAWRWLSPRDAPGAASFDVVRGELENVRLTAAGLSLGQVGCLEQGSQDTTTLGHEDAADPAPGRIFFYLVESVDAAGRRSSWGEERALLPRAPSGGGCRISLQPR